MPIRYNSLSQQHPTETNTKPTRRWPNGDPMTEAKWHRGFSLCDCELCSDDDDNIADADDDGYDPHGWFTWEYAN